MQITIVEFKVLLQIKNFVSKAQPNWISCALLEFNKLSNEQEIQLGSSLLRFGTFNVQPCVLFSNKTSNLTMRSSLLIMTFWYTLPLTGVE